MVSIRISCWTLLAAAGFALVYEPVGAQQPSKDDLPQKTSKYNEVSSFKAAPVIAPEDLPKAKAAFEALAKYNAEYISHPKVYSAPKEFNPPSSKFGETVATTDKILDELNRHILVPLPGSRVGKNNADYIRELGIALDAAIKEVIENNGERIVRLNATRMLAVACRSGATAHYPTVTGLISNPNTPPEVKHYAMKAAENLLAAYDLNDYRSRKHSAGPKEVGELISALQDAILKPSSILPTPAGAEGKLEALSPDQQQVLAFIRRQAVRSLAQVRFAEFKGADGKKLYPAVTLARVAMSDPALVPPPNSAEAAEAVIGILNMTPPHGRASKPYAYAMCDAVAAGLATFATPRAANPADKTQAWRGTAARMADAFKVWRALFDQNFDPVKPTAYVAELVPKPVNDLLSDAERRILTPMEGAIPKIDVDGIRRFRSNLRADKEWTLSPFLDNPTVTLPKTN